MEMEQKPMNDRQKKKLTNGHLRKPALRGHIYLKITGATAQKGAKQRVRLQDRLETAFRALCFKVKQ